VVGVTNELRVCSYDARFSGQFSMQTLRVRRDTPETRGEISPRSARATAISVALHALLVIALWQILQFPEALRSLLDRDPVAAPERLRYVVVEPGATAGAAVAPRPSVGSARRPTAPRIAPARVAPPVAVPVQPLIAPREVPTGIPAPGDKPAIDVGAPATGPLASGRGPLKGTQPGFTDPRLWVDAPAIEGAPKTGDERLDSAVVTSISKYRDSVLANTYSPNKYERGDWTYTTKGGQKYGIDGKYIRLGKLSIPTALLGLLPLNKMQGNPIAYEREQRLAVMRADIMEHAQAAMNEDEFRRAVKAIRERKEKQRKAEEKAKKAEPKTVSER
jgi:hypothetical protein